MQFFEQVVNWLGLGSTTRPEVITMREILDHGRRAKRGEDYEQALEAFTKALEIAQTLRDSAIIVLIDLHRVDVMITQSEYDTAESILNELRQKTADLGDSPQTAYVLCAWGTLAQARQQWEQARHYFEQALETARKVQAAGAEGRAMGHLADIFLQEGNASYAMHLLRDAIPKLDDTGDIELSSYFVGQYGQALIVSGDTVTGLDRLNQALRRAERLRDRRYERRWRLALARYAYQEANYAEAYPHFIHALKLFDVDTFSVERITALCEMSKTCLHLYRQDEALTYAQQAEKYSQKAADPALDRLVEGTLGVVLRNTDHSAEAIPHLEVAIAAYAAQPNDQHTHSELLRNLAAAYTDSGDLETAAQMYQQAIALAETHEADLELAQTRRDLGTLYAQQFQMEQAIQEWSAARTIYETHNHPIPVALLHCDIANARWYSGQGQRAIKDYEQALMLLSAIDDRQTRGIVLSNAANTSANQGDVASAQAFFEEAIDIAEELEQRHAEATRRGNYGWFLLAIGQYKRAKTLLEQALQMSRALKLDLQVAIQTDNLGCLNKQTGDSEAALTLQRQALEQIQAIANPHWQAILQTSLANTLLDLKQVDEAADLLQAALKTGRAIGSAEVIIRSLTGQAKVEIQRGTPQAADAPLTEAIALANKADMRFLKAEALAAQSEQQAALGHPKKAIARWDDAKKLYTMLYSPQARQQPNWLTETT